VSNPPRPDGGDGEQGAFTRRRFIGGAAAIAAAGSVGGGLAACDVTGFGNTRQPLESLPDFGVPQPTAYLRSNWSRDPYSLCAYSSLPPGPLGARARSILAEPVRRRLIFAGEATSSSSPSMVHGALKSGLRAAAQVTEVAPGGARVTVVGAGTAGLACARRLISEGHEVTVLEARDRLGGRVWTEEIAGVPAEMGASWIHGQRGNPLTVMADSAGVRRIPFAYRSTFAVTRQAAAGARGRRQLARGLNSFNWNRENAATTSIASVLPRRRTPGLEWAIESELAQEYGADPERLSMEATDEGDWLRGGDALLASSYQQLIVEATGRVPVSLNTVVKRIAYDRGGVEVSADSGGTYISDFAVVTVPIGVLKRGSIRFAPALPGRTLAAIGGLGNGLLDKLWLAFDEPFWDRDAEMISWIDPVRPGLWAEWVNGYRAFGKPVLLGFNGGNEAWRMARFDDRAVVESGMKALGSMYGR
jgi:monoamine oxidase